MPAPMMMPTPPAVISSRPSERRSLERAPPDAARALRLTSRDCSSVLLAARGRPYQTRKPGAFIGVVVTSLKRTGP